jgi:protein-S-isoprenylcysteine O-methyltransferase Ste14
MFYDLLMRLPLLVWASFCALRQFTGLVHNGNVAAIDLVSTVHVAMRLSMITFMLLVVAVVALRSRPSAKAGGLQPRISALAGSFIMYGVVFFPRADLSLSLEMLSTTLILIGTAGAVVTLYQLGRSFSIMAESRYLVMSGPYRFVRHPLYLTEAIAIIGMFIQFASRWTAFMLAVQIAFQFRRIHNEESVLSATFPEYAVYQQTTARLVPGIY